MILKEYDTLLITDTTKFIIVYQSNHNQNTFFIGLANSIEKCEALINEDIRNTNCERKHYGIIPCLENGLRPTCIDDLVKKQPLFEDPIEIFDKGWI